MKNLLKIILILQFVILLISCETGEQFTGTPENRLAIETIQATISTPATIALTDQKIKFTATLPRTFADTVTVECTALATSGGKRRASVDVMPNQLSATGVIEAIGGALFNSNFELSLTAIALKKVEIGKHYLLESNKLTIASGSSSIPVAESDRLQIRLLWPFASPTNNMNFNIDKPGLLADANVTTLQTYGKQHAIRTTGTSNSANLSSANGDYLLNFNASTLDIPQINLPYRVLLVHPDGKVEIFEGIYNNLTVGSSLKYILKVNKSTDANGVVEFTATL